MTSARKLEANRRNARASTGPRTAAGKARAAQNARRHGLSLAAASSLVPDKNFPLYEIVDVPPRGVLRAFQRRGRRV